MNFDHSTLFKKTFSKLSKKEKLKFEERMAIFIIDVYDPILKNHKLHGEYDGYRSINITGDIRLIYREISKDNYLLHLIGTHSELYT
jgi:addiction module RelE/StbE family toxin